MEGKLSCTEDTLVELEAHVLQVTYQLPSNMTHVRELLRLFIINLVQFFVCVFPDIVDVFYC